MWSIDVAVKSTIWSVHGSCQALRRDEWRLFLHLRYRDASGHSLICLYLAIWWYSWQTYKPITLPLAHARGVIITLHGEPSWSQTIFKVCASRGSFRSLHKSIEIAMIISWEDFTWLLPWVNHGMILRDICLDLIMGGFYVTCKMIPVHIFTFVPIIW